MPKISIVICSLNRSESLNRCLKSIEKQDYKDYEIILCQEEGNLVELKDKGWRKSKGEIVIFLDDDIEAQNNWLSNIVTIFDTRKDIIGITGPTYVPPAYLKNRDILYETQKRGWLIDWSKFSFRNLFRRFYNWFFLEGRQLIPGQITSCGVNTYGANYPTIYTTKSYNVDFLEPCQFALRRWVIEKVNGFDLDYKGVGEWCDVDLCYRIKQYGLLIFHPEIKVYHYPVKDAICDKRLETASRYRNYCRWSDKFIRKTFKHRLYRLFLKIYFFLKSLRIY